METMVIVTHHIRTDSKFHDQFGYSPSRSFREINCRTFQSELGILPTPLKPSNSGDAIRQACSSPGTPMTVTASWEEDESLNSDGKASSVPINIEARKVERFFSDGLSSSERWAGPTYSNSPPPSSLPIPKFSIPQKRSLSLEVPVSVSDGRIYPLVKSAPPSPTRDRYSSWRRFCLSNDSATRDLRRILHLDISDE